MIESIWLYNYDHESCFVSQADVTWRKIRKIRIYNKRTGILITLQSYVAEPKDIKNKRMMMIYRCGIVGNDEHGTPLLINDSGDGYRVNATAISLWNMYNGITFQAFLYVLRISSDDELCQTITSRNVE